jgi:hypothetical protein
MTDILSYGDRLGEAEIRQKLPGLRRQSDPAAFIRIARRAAETLFWEKRP